MSHTVLLTAEEIERCKIGLSKMPKEDTRARYLSWRLNSGVEKPPAKPIVNPLKKHYVIMNQPEYGSCVANLKNRDVLKWLSLKLPDPKLPNTWGADKSLNKLSAEVMKGVQSLDTLTVWVLRAQSVMQMKELTRFEEAPRFQVYVTNLIDRNIHFISHKWYGDRPDNEENGVLKYIQGLIILGTKKENKGIDENDLVWIDYCCVPQTDPAKKLQELVKIPYLLNYSAVHVFAEHPQYEKSIWCRLEQTVNAAIGPCKDLSQFWIQDPKDLLVLLPSLIQLDVAKMKIQAFLQIEQPDSLRSIVAFHPNYFRFDYLVPNNILLEMILYSLDC